MRGVLLVFSFLLAGQFACQGQSASAYLKSGNLKAQNGLVDEAFEDFSKAIALDSANAQAYYHRATLLHRQGADMWTLRKDPREEAIIDYSRAIFLQSNFANAYYGRGWIQYTFKNYQKAEADFSKAIQLAPSDTNANFSRGLVRLSAKDFKGAVKDFTASIKLNAKDKDAYFLRGKARLELKVVCLK